MGDSYRDEIRKHKKASGYKRQEDAYEDHWAASAKRAAIRLLDHRKPPFRHHTAHQGTMRL